MQKNMSYKSKISSFDENGTITRLVHYEDIHSTHINCELVIDYEENYKQTHAHY